MSPPSCTAVISILLLLLLLSRFSRVWLCNPIAGSPPGSPVPGILQARTLEWVAISFSNAWRWKVKGKSLSLFRPSATPWTAAYQAPPPMGFSRQEYWSGVPLPSPHLKSADEETETLRGGRPKSEAHSRSPTMKYVQAWALPSACCSVMPAVWVCSAVRTVFYRLKGLVDSRYLFLSILESRSPRSERQPGWVRALFQVKNFSLCPHRVEGARELSVVSFIKRALTPFMRAPLFWPKTSPPNAITPEVRISTQEFWEA